MLWLMVAVGNNWGKQQATSKSLKVKSRAGDVYKGFENLKCSSELEGCATSSRIVYAQKRTDKALLLQTDTEALYKQKVR